MPELVKPLKIRVAESLIRLEPDTGYQTPIKAQLVIAPLQRRTIDMLVAMLRENRLRDEQEYQVLGENLWAVLLSNKIGEALHDALQKTEQMLRVELEFADDDLWLASWPWEYLYCPFEPGNEQSGFFLAKRTSRLSLTRQVRLEKPRPLRVEQPPVKVLFVVASPDPSDEREPLNEVQYQRLHEELLEFERSLEGKIQLMSLIAPHKQSKEYIPNEVPKATYENFFRVMEQFEPHVVHFVGHGKCVAGGGQLAFVGLDYKADWKADTDLAADFMDCKETRLVFLQACESALPDPYQAISGVAMQLAHRNIPAVVAMQYKVENAVASLFARAFYRALAESRPVDAAVQAGRKEIAGHVKDWARRAFGLPVLYLRESEALVPSEGRLGGGVDRQVVAQPSFRIVNPGVRTVSVEPAIPRRDERLENVSASTPARRDVIQCPQCGTPYVPSPEKNFCSNPACRRRLVCPYPNCRMRLPLGEEEVCGCCGQEAAKCINPGAGDGVFDHYVS